MLIETSAAVFTGGTNKGREVNAAGVGVGIGVGLSVGVGVGVAAVPETVIVPDIIAPWTRQK